MLINFCKHRIFKAVYARVAHGPDLVEWAASFFFFFNKNRRVVHDGFSRVIDEKNRVRPRPVPLTKHPVPGC